MMPNKIGVIDSGIGGLNILSKLLNVRPNNNYIYYGDTRHLPYGDKTYDELLEYASNIIRFLITEGVNTIVIACGTLCSTVYSDLVKLFPNIKFINIVDATCNYLNQSDYKRIGVIATSNTINSHSFKKRLNKDVIEVASPMLVPVLEDRNKDKYDYYIDYYLKDMLDIDVLVLGCTHYIILKDKIKAYLNKPVINMADYILEDIPNQNTSSLAMYFSKVDDNLINNVKEIIGSSNIILKELNRK